MATSITALGQLVGHPVVTDADADALTAGASSNADSLHTHNGKANVSHSHPRSDLTTESLAIYPLNFADWGDWDLSFPTGDPVRLPFVSAGTPPGQPYSHISVAGAGAAYKVKMWSVLPNSDASDQFGGLLSLPPEYVAGGTVKLVFRVAWVPDGAGETGTPTAQITLTLRKLADDGIAGDSLVSGAGQDIVKNGGDITWTVTTAGLNPGDRFVLGVLLFLQMPDEEESVHLEIGNAELQCDIKG